MTKVSAFWLERYTPPTPIPYCQQGAGVFEKLAPPLSKAVPLPVSLDIKLFMYKGV